MRMLPGVPLRRGVTGRTLDGAYSGDQVEPGFVDVWKKQEAERVVGPAPPARAPVAAK